MRLKYNAPTILTYTFICFFVMIITVYLLPDLIYNWFMVPGRQDFSPLSLRNWVSVFTHVIGHSGWNHLGRNFSIILLVGPMLEENHGSIPLLVMIAITSVVTGILNVIIFNTALMGASGVAFMMILLASFTNFSRGEIPLTFLLVLVLYLGDQVLSSFSTSNISNFAHIAGGFCGSLFGFFHPPKK